MAREIYARLTVENSTSETETTVAQLFESYFNNKAAKFNEKMANTAERIEVAKVTMSFKELNMASDVVNFEQALNYTSLAYTNSKITKSTFDEMKALYNGDVKDLDKVSLTDVQNFSQKNYNPNDSFLTIAGDIIPSLAKSIANKAFGNWNHETSVSK